MDHETLVLIEEHIRRLCTAMGFSSLQLRATYQDEQLQIVIEAGEDGRLLIGPNGQHLQAFQYIMRSVLRHQLPPKTRVLVDVNSYRAQREKSLVYLAQETAKKALTTGRTVALHPMSPADRRAIHAALAPRTDIRTESLGDEPNRRVVVRPVFM